MSLNTAPTITLHYGVVKQVLSGDAIILRGSPKSDGPPAERQLCLTNILAPRLGRRPTPMNDSTPDEPYAWDSREYLRKRLIGKEVCFTIDYKVPNSGREYGNVYLGKDIYSENINNTMIKEGLADVRKTGMRINEELSRLIEFEEKAKASGKGKWNAKENPQNHVRKITHNVPDIRNFIEVKKGQVLKGIVEFVRDGSTLRIMLLPNFETITLMISGIKCPSSRRENDQEVSEPFFEEARFYTESRLLQREVDVICEGASNNSVIGSVIHAKGNVAEFLLKEGYAKCVDWSLSSVSYNPQRLRNAEKIGKERRIRLWKDYIPLVEHTPENRESKAVLAKVVEIINAESMLIKVLNTGEIKKIFLSSIRGPKMDQSESSVTQQDAAGGKGKSNKNSRPLYEIPFLFEAREFLRKRLIGKKVHVNVDFVQPASMGYAEKICCTVTFGGVNVAGALVSKGLATVIRYSNRNPIAGSSSNSNSNMENRSPLYEELLSAEAQAAKKQIGAHSPPQTLAANKIRVVEIGGATAKQFWPSLSRAGRLEGVVEYVASGSRFRIYLARDSWLITFLLGGINCPKGARPLPGGSGFTAAEPFSQEALDFAKEAVLQRDVEIEVESLDRAGNIIGYLFYPTNASADNKQQQSLNNLNVDLIRASLASVHFTADKSAYVNQLYQAQNEASGAQHHQGIWSLPPTDPFSPLNPNYAGNSGGSAPNSAKQTPAAGNNEEPEEAIPNEKIENGESIPLTSTSKVSAAPANHHLPRVMITEILPDTLSFYCQSIDKGDDLIQMMTELRKALHEQSQHSNIPTFEAKKGELCASQFVDNEWYRAKIEKISGQSITVFYIDYGNREVTDASRLTYLPPHFTSISPQAKEYSLACVVVPSDDDFKEEALHQFRKESFNKEFLLEVQYKVPPTEYVSLYTPVPNPDNDKLFTKGTDFVKTVLVAEGYLLAEPRRERKLTKMVKEYMQAQEEAKNARRNLWRYGDFTPDDAFEFGFKK